MGLAWKRIVCGQNFELIITTTRNCQRSCHFNQSINFLFVIIFSPSTWPSYQTDLLNLRLVQVVGAGNLVESLFSQLGTQNDYDLGVWSQALQPFSYSAIPLQCWSNDPLENKSWTDDDVVPVAVSWTQRSPTEWCDTLSSIMAWCRDRLRAWGCASRGDNLHCEC